MSCKIDFKNDWELKFQGAESRIYFGTHSNNRCVIKHRFSKEYRHPTLDKKLTKERTKRERKIMDKIRAKSKVLSSYMPRVLWSDDSTILMTEIVDCESLYSYIERQSDPSLTAQLETMVGECIAELHNLGIVHGDLTTSNLMLVPLANGNGKTEEASNVKTDTASRIKKVKSNDLKDTHIVLPIDFGLATGSAHAEERAVDLYVLERALLSTHFPDSSFFKGVLDSYLCNLNESLCEPPSKQKIVERLHEVRARGRKSDYAANQEA